MKIYINKLILSGWALYIISLVIPWSDAPFSGQLPGWFWQGINFFPFYYLVTFTEAKIAYIGAYTGSLSIIIMFISPLLLFLLNRTASKYYGYIIIVGFLLAFFSFCFEIFYSNQSSTLSLLLLFGYCVYVSSFGVLSIGFIKQISYIRKKNSSA